MRLPIRPTRRLLALALAGFPVSLVPAILGRDLFLVWPAFLLGGIALVLLDFALAVPARRLDRRLAVPRRLVLGEPGRAEVTLATRGTRGSARVEVHLDLSEDLEPVADATVEVGPGRAATATLPLVPRRRGTVGVEAVWLRWTGPLGLLERVVTERRRETIAVVPDLARARRGAIRWLERRDVTTGVKPVAWAGEGSEFESMRDHAAGMDPRRISWRASARHRRLVSHEFRAERNHQVIVAFDTGRLLSESVGGVPKLDHAVVTGLHLAHAALRIGDRVGMYAFDERPRGFVPPRGGVRHGERLEGFTADLAYGSGETNFTLGLAELTARLTRRSFVVLLTDVVDSVTAELMVENAGLFARRHLLAFVALRDPSLEGLWHAPPRSLSDVYRSVVAADLVRERERVRRRLEQRGVFVVDAAPAEVTVPLLNRYLHVKRRELVA